MPRPPRIERPNGLFHVTQRATDHEVLYADNDDRIVFEHLLGLTVRRHGWLLEASCQMTNHYHLVLWTPTPNLARGMQYLNARYVQSFNARHARRGALVQGRYYSGLVEDDEQYTHTIEYVAQNPVKAGLCARAEDWPWSRWATKRAAMTASSHRDAAGL